MVDASALAKYLLREEGWAEVSRYLRERRPLYTVDHALKELANSVWKHARLRRLIDAATAINLMKAFMRLIESGAIIVEGEDKYLGRALEIALDTGLTVYDALYIAQAERHGELLTSDRRQAGVAETLGVKVHYIK